jgi:pimeloyl-ACP methyl ester carboxylesterase
LERQSIQGHPSLSNSHLWFVAVEHEGNQNSASEEVGCIADIIRTLVQPGVNWMDSEGQVRVLRAEDILVVAPYNAQVSDLLTRLPPGRIGTVDKFQGQQAPVVIYSLTTSSPEDAPRGMEFLYSLNRLNVATTNSAASSALYWENKSASFSGGRLELPVTVYLYDIYQAPKNWVEDSYPYLIYWNEVEHGGHFAALEAPDLFGTEVRNAFRSLRGL